MILYFGPETMMPLASVLAAVGGVLLLFWHRLVGFVRALSQGVRRLFGRGPDRGGPGRGGGSGRGRPPGNEGGTSGGE